MSKPEDQAQADPLLGTTFARRYLIERRLGRGGMGVVYQATQIDLNRPVVLKVLAPDWVGDSEALARFEREARGLSSLQHPNIVTIHDFGRIDGRAFIVMEYVQGETLDRFVRRRGHLTLADFVPIAAQVLKGLGEAHSRGIIHRDIKPANIMLCERQGRANYVKILDFGLAKLVSGSSDITKQNVLGTPTCLSPEQILGEKIDQRVDVYAVGILFYFMLTGVMPFQADNDASVLYKHVHEKAQPIQDLLPPDNGVPEGVLELISRCLEKSRERRPRDANEVVEGLIDQVPFSMFRLPRAQPRTEPLEPEEPQSSTEHSKPIPSPENIVVGTFGRPRSAPAAAAAPLAQPMSGAGALAQSMPSPVMPITAQFPQATLDQLKAQGIPLEGGSLVQSQDGRTLLVVGPQAQEAAARQRTFNLILVGAAAFSVLALLLYAFGGGSNEAEADRPEVATREEGGREQLESNLDKIAQLIDEGKLPQAERKLEIAEEEFARDPELSDRADELRSKLEVQKALASARKYERDGDRISAVKGYRDVLALDAANEEAKQRIKGLFPELNPDMGFAIITIRSAPVTAEVTLDGRPLGSTTVEVPLHAGKYNLTLAAPGYGPMQTALSVSAAKDQPYDYMLTAKAGTTPIPQPPVEQPKPPAGGGTKKPGGGGTKRPPDGQVKQKPNPAPDDDLLPVGPSKKR
ncbi:serine/threonine-protein kinase [Nannocystis sp. SCPEA4]|uniref:serine/threonine-protein kinase n=1 Tax=Nannocystis sp. SCPEA4 TaxID=2996787 RepID=UPI00226DC7D9|nr:serine/threonine-protein kinase [Nannocystis sp. SCPEA4]MCY1053509.1 protein kinase [Nannocystis sp. SCPEA4]